MPESFFQGQELTAIFLQNEGVYRVGVCGCIMIKVVMQHGQMDTVPWVRVYFDSPERRATMWNLALIEGVEE